MDTVILAPTIDRTADKRLHVSRARRVFTLKGPTLFRKGRHGEEWHQQVETTAGVLHPSDSEFPWGLLRNHTDIYLKKKGKISRADTDKRLAMLLERHNAKDIAVASIAHAMAAKSLRQLLSVELNVTPGSYWGLDTWLQSLIAANDGNPASVTTLEAQWARMLLPYATHGAHAAGLYLKGVSRVLKKFPISSLYGLPDFAVLVRRAIADYAAQLEGFWLRCEWVAAQEVVFWMTELELSPASTLPLLRLEHLLDAQFATWKAWAHWRPDFERITRLENLSSTQLSAILDVAALEGPDVITSTEGTIRQALISQYREDKSWIQYRELFIEVNDCTTSSLSSTLDRLARGLDTVSISGPGHGSLFELFRDLTTTLPKLVTEQGLDLFEAVLEIPYTSEDLPCKDIRTIWIEREHLSKGHVLALQHLITILNRPQAESLRKVFLHEWLFRGIERCFEDCQNELRSRIGKGAWLSLLLGLQNFCKTLETSIFVFPRLRPHIKPRLRAWPELERMTAIVEIYEAAQAQRLKEYKSRDSVVWIDPDTSKTYISAPSKMGERHPLEFVIEDFCLHLLPGLGSIKEATQRKLEDILHIWEATQGPPPDNDRRTLAIILSRHTGAHDIIRCKCLVELASENVPESSISVKDLLSIVSQADTELQQAIVALTKVLATREGCTQCWKGILYRWIEHDDRHVTSHETTLTEYSLRTMNTAEWLSFMHSLEMLFSDFPQESPNQRTLPDILQPKLLNWVSEVSKFSETLTRLENALSDRDAVRSILTCTEKLWAKNLLSILSCLKSAQETSAELMMQKATGCLSGGKMNDWEVKDCLFTLLDATPEAIEACEAIWDAHHGFLDIPGLPIHEETSLRRVASREDVFYDNLSERETTTSHPELSERKPIQSPSPKPITKRRYGVPPEVAEVMIAGYIQDGNVAPEMKVNMDSVARLLNLEVYHDAIPEDVLALATAFWAGIEEEILEEVDRLEALKKALKMKDPQGTALLLEEYGIPQTSPLEEEIMGLPTDIIDVVELIDEDEIEISFSLNTLTELHRNAMGVPPAAKTLIVRLLLAEDMRPRFCTHFDTDLGLETLVHFPWICSKMSSPPKALVCASVSGPSQSAFVWQLNRVIFRHLQNGTFRIVELHKHIKHRIGEMGQVCISCGVSHNAKSAHLRRSTPCNLFACAQLWYNLPLEVRIPEVRTDTPTVDLLLTSVYAAAATSNISLLPTCPIRSPLTIKQILNSLPKLSIIRDALHPSLVLASYHKDAEKLISWACLHFRGYITSATGAAKIHNLPPGTHQFLLANAGPALESSFLSRFPSKVADTMVLFHGTAMDRLPAILAQGLRIYSGTALQRTGAAYGSGIYLAEDPGTSLSYSPGCLSWVNSSFSNMRIVLGCELVGGGKKAVGGLPGVHLVADPASVMVRYVFLVRREGGTMVRGHVGTAMGSVMGSLRGGVL
ncbi:hypothetical protein BDW02DRAFT_598630 [Decorospora gaudefroyi]|uniref:Poly [ADP-ribose] polymerase n=1 Tax=Decorospora gaudefroyi TaxID=184978 RepID=A0A6A5KF97_9PLEO|nr:hypothetical protein BDW02DRAFT_598630 [Decorospora gaudefroyi]